MIPFNDAIISMQAAGLKKWAEILPEQLQQVFSQQHGHWQDWLRVYEQLLEIHSTDIQLNADRLRIGSAEALTAQQQQQLQTQLQALKPWRKGPFEIYGIHIDTEWRSDWKWQRLLPYLEDLAGRKVLDVGCGSGYHCLRMLGAGAETVIGIEPFLLYVVQFYTLKKLMQPAVNAHVLPLTMEQVPENLAAFDTVFSMGVLYHRRSPLDHLIELRNALRKDGQLLLETLIVDGPPGYSLVPDDRYAQMRNVWFLPSTDTLVQWLKRCGFVNIKLCDVNQTSIEEQRSTPWSKGQSLQDFLDSDNHNLTIEAYPAPKRAILTASRP